MKGSSKALLSALMAAVFAGCILHHSPKPPEEYKEFLSKPLAEQERLLNTLPLDDRYAIFFYHTARVVPSNPFFVHEMANGGDEVVPFLVSKLKTETNDRGRVAIYHVFVIIADYRTATLNPETFQVLKEELNRFKDSEYRKQAEGWFDLAVKLSKRESA